MSAWNNKFFFPETESLMAVKLKELFVNSADQLLAEVHVTIEEDRPQDQQFTHRVILNRSGGMLTANMAGVFMSEIYTVRIISDKSQEFDTFYENADIAAKAEYFITQIKGDGISDVDIESSNYRVKSGAEEYFRVFTANVLVRGKQI